MAKYINIPFAESGNKTAIPDTTTDGTVNYTDGFGGDYARPLGTDPLAKTVDRETINQALYDYGTAIQQLQENGFFAWQSTKSGGYDVGAIVSLNGVNYENTVAANTATPPNNGWKLLSDADTVDGVQGALLGVGGAGYTWVDETANRVIGTTYTNTYGHPIQVTLLLKNTQGYTTLTNMSFVVDGVQVSGENDTDNHADTTFGAIVPNGSTYIAYGDGSSDIVFWSELK